jgi:predicted transcriptional regulator of viral defense system
MTQDAGMGGHNADISGRSGDSGAPLERLRGSKLRAFFRPAQLDAVGLTRAELRTLVRSGQVERVGRGLYRLADTEVTEHYSLAMVSARVPKSIICLLTALSVHEIGTQSPHAVWLAIPHKARVPRLSEIKLKIVRFSGPAWTYGVQDIELEGVPGRITSPARTIVDCFRFEHLVGTEPMIEALHDGLRQHKVTIAELSRVEQVLPSRRLRAMLDLRSI